MPVVFVAKTGGGGRVLWRCCVNARGNKTASACGRCVQCRAYKVGSRERCRNRSCFGSLCSIHLRRPFYEHKNDAEPVLIGVRTGPSTIPNAGMGLFATRDFKFNVPIMRFEFEQVTRQQLDSRYNYKDDDGNDVSGLAPYGITLSAAANQYADAACSRNAPSFANDKRGVRGPYHGANATISPYRANANAEWQVWLRTRKGTPAQNKPSSEAVAIHAGDEIFISYGPQYWNGAGTITTLQHRVPVAKQLHGAKSRIVRPS